MTPLLNPIASAVIKRLRGHVDALAASKTTDDVVAALFLAHCVLKDVEATLPAPEPLTLEEV